MAEDRERFDTLMGQLGIARPKGCLVESVEEAMAKRAGVKELWLTHFSPSLVRADDYMPQVRAKHHNFIETSNSKYNT